MIRPGGYLLNKAISNAAIATNAATPPTVQSFQDKDIAVTLPGLALIKTDTACSDTIAQYEAGSKHIKLIQLKCV
jgi:hypothetical protein